MIKNIYKFGYCLGDDSLSLGAGTLSRGGGVVCVITILSQKWVIYWYHFHFQSAPCFTSLLQGILFRLLFELDSYLIWLFKNVYGMFDVLLGDNYLLFVYPGQPASSEGTEPPPIDSKLHTTQSPVQIPFNSLLNVSIEHKESFTENTYKLKSVKCSFIFCKSNCDSVWNMLWFNEFKFKFHV